MNHQFSSQILITKVWDPLDYLFITYVQTGSGICECLGMKISNRCNINEKKIGVTLGSDLLDAALIYFTSQTWHFDGDYGGGMITLTYISCKIQLNPSLVLALQSGVRGLLPGCKSGNEINIITFLPWRHLLSQLFCFSIFFSFFLSCRSTIMTGG